MGGAVSSGRNNDDLIDNLLEADYIKSAQIERVFRAVDRAEYFLPEFRGNAYKDLAWKSGNLHLSAPCIYSEVMEGLCLAPGLSFLNLGSGTGYLSTMVGLILGTNGVNHGIELHEDVILYANRKLEDFKRYSGALDEYDFCEPKFRQGNCLSLTSECTALYDRIYCGAGCPEQYKDYMKSLIKVGGVLVMPINDQLFQIKRTTKAEWKAKSLLPVSFASLILPPEDFQDFVHPIEIEPLSLQVLCRAVVRNILRRNIEIDHPPAKRVKFRAPSKEPKRKRVLKRLVVPLFDDDESSDEDRHVRIGGDRNHNAGRASFRSDDGGIFSFFLGMGGRRSSGDRESSSSSSRRNRESRTNQESMEVDSNIAEESSNHSTAEAPTSQEVRAVIEHHPDPQNRNEANQGRPEGEQSLDTINDISDVLVECLEVLRRERASLERQRDDLVEEMASQDNQENENEENAQREVEGGQNEMQNKDEAMGSNNPSTSAAPSKSNGKREKFDSGLGDEIIEARDSSDDDDEDEEGDNMKLDAISSCDEEQATSGLEKRQKRGTRRVAKLRRMDCRSRSHNQDNSSEFDTEEDTKQVDNELKMYQSPFTEHMKAKIQELPLPLILKRYLNYYREF
ncbi:uncharacterized protein LOC115881164 [Sitophilus oryzae]|uniref:Uncharacterized protein LOC115881164 n=1 Tax=Sitophilus oryzae TaxID=7048 RepID=A0A6J2XTQ2_SITOR|nr:uncharacterized protein LOC115881164 [Sitophilus oryzae]